MGVADNLNNILGIDPNAPHYTGEDIVVEPHEQLALPAPPKANTELTVHEGDVIEDYTKARKAFNDVIDMGNTASKELAALGKETEHPRAYEVMATMLNTISAAAKELMQNQVTRKTLVGAPAQKLYEPPGVTVEKAVFVGTLSDLLENKKNDN